MFRSRKVRASRSHQLSNRHDARVASVTDYYRLHIFFLNLTNVEILPLNRETLGRSNNCMAGKARNRFLGQAVDLMTINSSPEVIVDDTTEKFICSTLAPYSNRVRFASIKVVSARVVDVQLG